MNIRTLGVICGILSGFFWGTMDIAAQYLLHTVRMAPTQFISLTMVVTTAALFGISLATRPKETFLAAADKQNVFQFFLFGVLVLLTQVSFYVCVKYSNAETAAVIAATRPFCIMGLLLFAAVMPTASQIFCCALALIGVCLMMTKGKCRLHDPEPHYCSEGRTAHRHNLGHAVHHDSLQPLLSVLESQP